MCDGFVYFEMGGDEVVDVFDDVVFLLELGCEVEVVLGFLIVILMSVGGCEV